MTTTSLSNVNKAVIRDKFRVSDSIKVFDIRSKQLLTFVGSSSGGFVTAIPKSNLTFEDRKEIRESLNEH